MNILNEDIDILIAKSVSGNATSEEANKVEAWLAQSPDNKLIYDRNILSWENSQGWISSEIIQQDKTLIYQATQKQLSTQIHKLKKRSLIYRLAAILAIPLTFAFSWYFISHQKNSTTQNQFCSVTAPKGHVSKCTLPDGTEVWINTGSTLTYNTSLFNKKIRNIELKGEAYFNVAKNKNKPFKVHTMVGNVIVTGTAFNIKAYPESGAFETVLEEGSIEMELNNKTHQTVNLVPGDRAVFNLDGKGIIIEKVDPEMFSSWRNGEIIFKDATLNDLIKELERIYDIQFHLKDSQLGEFRFRGMFSYNNNLIDALEKIKKTAGIDYYIENKELWLSKK